MTEHERQLDERLEELGDRLRSRPSVVEQGMRTIEHMPQAKPVRRVVLVPALARSGLGLAACLAAGVCLWLCLAGPTNITLAEVQRSIDSKPWVLIRYEDGLEEWIDLQDRVSFLAYRKVLAEMRDHVNGIRRIYHSSWGRQILEEQFTPRPSPQTPWEYATGDWDDRGIVEPSRVIVERAPDTVDGREVVRFDMYDEGPMGLRALAQQVWADPKTRLPVRIRKYRGPGRNNDVDTGGFSFPARGPSTIHDLGVPKGLPVVTSRGVIEPAARAILDAAKEALRQFPRDVRIIWTNEYVDSGVSISYRIGDKLRKETYGRVDPVSRSRLPVELPQDMEQIGLWAASHLTLFELCIYDGEFEYLYDPGNRPWLPPASPGGTLSVRRRRADWVDSLLPVREQWPFIDSIGPMKVLEDAPGTPSGCVLLRYEGPNLRRDWYVDPAHDHICMKQVALDSRAGREQRSQVERGDLTRLASGQWYARTLGIPVLMATNTRIDVQLFSEAEAERLTEANEGDLFSGEKLLKEAMDRGAKVTFWAR